MTRVRVEAESMVDSAAEVTVREDETSSLTTFPTACINLVDSLGSKKEGTEGGAEV